MRTTTVLAAAGCLLVAAVAAADGAPWTRVAADARALPAARDRVPADRLSVFTLDAARLDATLALAPLEGTAAGAAGLPVVALPHPDGTTGRYRVEESPILDAELAARFPQIRTYALTRDDGAVGRLARTPGGISAIVLERGRALRVAPLGTPDGRHAGFVESDVVGDASVTCGADGTVGLPPLVLPPDLPLPQIASGSSLRTYRLAVATTGEYYAARGGNDASVLAAITTDMNLVNARYGVELAIRFVIVNATTNLFYTNAMTDPYTDGAPCTMRGEAQVDIPAVIGDAAFDIGHVFGAVAAGGCAGGANACTAAKANGASTFQTDLAHPPGHEDFGGYRLVMHEMGHQFGAGHTWNASNVGNCTPAQYSQASGVEPSGGTTIMSYSGTCAPDDVQGGVADAYFHTFSHGQIVTFSTLGSGNDCPVVAPSGNGSPVVDAGPDYTIPRSTPFTLAGSASDPDGHALTYAWEQVDTGLGQLPPNLDDGGSPLFRSFPASATGDVRTFPQWPVVLGDLAPQVGETLPTTDRVMTFRLVARDGQAVGGVDSDTAVITTSGGFFAVTAPGQFDLQRAGCAVTVDWAVGSAGDHADDARIVYSTDGGATFDQVLAIVPIDAPPAVVTLPCTPTTEGRIQVQAVGNVFFDVNPGDFEVVAEPPAIDLAAQPASVGPGCAADVAFSATVTDDCGLLAADVEVAASLASGTATVGVPAFAVMQQDATTLVVTGSVPVSDLSGCPAEVAIEVTSRDACGFESATSVLAGVTDQTPPQLVGVPADAVVECDAVPAPPAVGAVDDCAVPALAELTEQEIPGPCAGTYDVVRTWTATDHCGNVAQAQQLVTVQDTTPPAVTPGDEDLACLWPPNRRMACFFAADFAPAITDACSEPVTWRFAGCASDQEEDGGGGVHAGPDCVVADDGASFCVRAEREGGDPDGRRYAIAIVATDACGNAGDPVVIGHVLVPHSKSQQPDCGH